MSSNWGENPENQRSSLMQYSLPALLFSECSRFCINEGIHPTNEEETTCIKNCQTKVHNAFEMYMSAYRMKQAQKAARSYVDISKYTGMEIEHKHDTASELPHDTSPHVNVDTLKQFTTQMKKVHSGLNAKAI